MHSIARRKSPDFDEIWCTNADLELDDSHMTKYESFKNSKMVDTAIIKVGFWP